MTTLTASDIAALRIREARGHRGWRVRDLADRCRKAGFPRLTAAVITNLETRRRPGREISAEELLALALVLEVPPVQLLSPLNGDEELQVVPGEDKGPLEATAWLADDDAMDGPVRIAGSSKAADTERALRYRGNPLTLLRQIRVAARQIRFHDRYLSDEAWGNISREPLAYHKNSVTVLTLRLLHLTAALGEAGYTAPRLEGVPEIIARHGLPDTLAGWDENDEEEVPGGEGP